MYKAYKVIVLENGDHETLGQMLEETLNEMYDGGYSIYSIADHESMIRVVFKNDRYIITPVSENRW